METKSNRVVVLSDQFSDRIIKMVRYIQKNAREYHMTGQVLRSGTSIGANVAEAERAVSLKQFHSKMCIAYSECGETAYWLKKLFTDGRLTEPQYKSIAADCDELERVLSSITKTTREKLKEE